MYFAWAESFTDSIHFKLYVGKMRVDGSAFESHSFHTTNNASSLSYPVIAADGNKIRVAYSINNVLFTAAWNDDFSGFTGPQTRETSANPDFNDFINQIISYKGKFYFFGGQRSSTSQNALYLGIMDEVGNWGKHILGEVIQLGYHNPVICIDTDNDKLVFMWGGYQDSTLNIGICNLDGSEFSSQVVYTAPGDTSVYNWQINYADGYVYFSWEGQETDDYDSNIFTGRVNLTSMTVSYRKLSLLKYDPVVVANKDKLYHSWRDAARDIFKYTTNLDGTNLTLTGTGVGPKYNAEMFVYQNSIIYDGYNNTGILHDYDYFPPDPPPPETRDLIIEILPPGKGVTDPIEGTYTYQINEIVGISASPNTPYRFGWWGGNGYPVDVLSPDSEIPINTPYDILLTAVFIPPAFLDILRKEDNFTCLCYWYNNMANLYVVEDVTDLAVWDIPSPIPTGRIFTVSASWGGSSRAKYFGSESADGYNDGNDHYSNDPVITRPSHKPLILAMPCEGLKRKFYVEG